MSDLRATLEALGVKPEDLTDAVSEARQATRRVSKWAGVAERALGHMAEKAKPGTKRHLYSVYASLAAGFVRGKADVLLRKGKGK